MTAVVVRTRQDFDRVVQRIGWSRRDLSGGPPGFVRIGWVRRSGPGGARGIRQDLSGGSANAGAGFVRSQQDPLARAGVQLAQSGPRLYLARCESVWRGQQYSLQS